MSESLLNAFATVAADARTRGKELRIFLTATLADETTDETIRIHAADILIRTHLPEIVDTVVRYADELPKIRTMVSSLGDVAVPSLAEGVANHV